MKVVLFCGGLGMRIREYSENIPKPMVPIGYRPVLWHVMKFYAHYGHKDFILCLGHGAEVVKNYFLNYNECASNDFVMSQGGRKLDLVNMDIHDWNITFADTGVHTNIGHRLRAVEKYLAGEGIFLANYSDGLTDLRLDDQIDQFMKLDKVASLLSVRPRFSTHVIHSGSDGVVSRLEDMDKSGLRINGGYFIFRKDIFRYMQEGEELVHEPFERLIKEGKLLAFKYDGFWAAMDTFKDKQHLDELLAKGTPPWQVWKKPS